VDFWELTKLLFRRWYISAPMLVLSVAAALFAGASVKPDYKATEHLQLIPPVGADTPTPGKPHNPWNDLGVAALGNAATIGISDKTVLDKLTASGLTDTFTVTLDPRSPIATVEAVGHTAKQAIDTANAVATLFTQKISSLQSPYGVTQDQLITTHSLDTGSNVETVTSKVKRALAVIGGVGLLFTAAVTIGLDAMLRKRSRRRAEKTAVQPVSPAAPSDPSQPARRQRDAADETVRIQTSHVRDARVGPPTVYHSEGGDESTAPVAVTDAVSMPRGATGSSLARAPETEEPKDESDRSAQFDGSVIDSDATIVLPMPSKEYWATRGGKGKRR
jgi:hypothetical protein